jgi:membrane protease YdiL (CAAX protease family)
LKNNTNFDKRNLLRKEAVNKKNLKEIIKLFIFAAIILGIYTYFFEHARFLSFPRQATALWAAIMILYPLLSVYPQEIIYRAFFFNRYKDIFRSERIIIFSSALAFGYAHIIFTNYIAVSLSFAGGLLFGENYRKNKSLALVSIEHALYGCWLFTIGLGWYFFHGAR